jgi:hypothetical protein
LYLVPEIEMGLNVHIYKQEEFGINKGKESGMELLLNERELLNLGENLRGLRIVCREGRCWLTQAGDSRDHILRAGDSFTVSACGQLIITATESCRLMLVEPVVQHRQLSPVKILYGLLKGCTAGSV